MHPGTLIRVKVNLSSSDVGNLRYNWSTDKGKISVGRNTPSIEIDTRDIDARGPTVVEVTVKVEIGGLPETCVTSASEKYSISTGIFDPAPADTYGLLRFSEERARLDNLASRVLSSPGMKGYVVKAFKKGTPEKVIQNRLKRIKYFLFTLRKYPNDRFVIMVDPGREATYLWNWPSSGDLSPCDTCKIY